MPQGKGAMMVYDESVADQLQPQQKVEVEIYIADQHFASGGCRNAYHCYFCQDGRPSGKKLVAKKYIRDEGFADDYVCSQMANGVAKAFNARCPFKKVSYLIPNRIVTLGRENYSLEDFLDGQWEKHNDIFGNILSKKRTPQAFSHFSWIFSNKKYVILDVQGVEETYTDPAVVSVQTRRFGYTDTGLRGIRDFFQRHQCNEVCQALGLEPVSHIPDNLRWEDPPRPLPGTSGTSQLPKTHVHAGHSHHTAHYTSHLPHAGLSHTTSGHGHHPHPLTTGTRTTATHRTTTRGVGGSVHTIHHPAATATSTSHHGSHISSSTNAHPTHATTHTTTPHQHISRQYTTSTAATATHAHARPSLHIHTTTHPTATAVTKEELSAPTKPPVTAVQLKDELDKLRALGVFDLKKMLTERLVDFSGCLEKADLITKLLQHKYPNYVFSEGDTAKVPTTPTTAPPPSSASATAKTFTYQTAYQGGQVPVHHSVTRHTTNQPSSPTAATTPSSQPSSATATTLPAKLVDEEKSNDPGSPDSAALSDCSTIKLKPWVNPSLDIPHLEDIPKMPVKALKAALFEMQLNFDDCLERQDLVDKLQRAVLDNKRRMSTDGNGDLTPSSSSSNSPHEGARQTPAPQEATEPSTTSHHRINHNDTSLNDSRSSNASPQQDPKINHSVQVDTHATSAIRSTSPATTHKTNLTHHGPAVQTTERQTSAGPATGTTQAVATQQTQQQQGEGQAQNSQHPAATPPPISDHNMSPKAVVLWEKLRDTTNVIYRKTMFLKYGKRGNPHRRYLSIKLQWDSKKAYYTLFLCWQDVQQSPGAQLKPAPKQESRKLSLDTLREIHLNSDGAKFKNHLTETGEQIRGRKGNLHDSALCFSLVFGSNPQRTIDLLAMKEDDYQQWTQSFTMIVQANRENGS